jgi:Tol biopolymer transport system component
VAVQRLGIQRSALVSIAAFASLLVVAAPALATFAGKNGEIAYIGIKNGLQTVFATETGALTPHSFPNEPFKDFEPAYSPDGSQIAFIRQVGFYDRNIMVMRSDGSALRMEIDDDIFPPESARLAWPAWSADGKRISFQIDGGHSSIQGIWTSGDDGLTHTIQDGSAQFPDWSPVGNQMVYVCRFRPQRDDLCVYDADSGAAREIAIDVPSSASVGVRVFEPNWTPDGKRIVFTAQYDTSEGGRLVTRLDIFSNSASGGGVTKLTDSGPDICTGDQFGKARFAHLHPRPSPDGSTIVTVVFDQVASSDGRCTGAGSLFLGTLSANGGAVTPLVVEGPDIRPDNGQPWITGGRGLAADSVRPARPHRRRPRSSARGPEGGAAHARGRRRERPPARIGRKLRLRRRPARRLRGARDADRSRGR